MKMIVDILRRYYVPRIDSEQEQYAQLGWEDAQAQQKRFHILLNAVDLNEKSLLDIGCGLGDLYGYLQTSGISVDYFGIDVLEEMITKARIRYPDVLFMHTDLYATVLQSYVPFNVLFASGIFNLRVDDNWRYLETMVSRMAKICDDTALFNLLRNNAPDQDPILYHYFDPHEVITMARNYFPTVTLIDGYLNNDMTIVCHQT